MWGGRVVMSVSEVCVGRYEMVLFWPSFVIIFF